MKEQVVFEANVPVTATLAYADGLKVQGRFGDQVMYSLTDGRVMYVPPIVRGRLLELGIRQNDPFAICRAERREGYRRFVDWVVQPHGAASQAPIANSHTEAFGSPVNKDSSARFKPNGNGNGNSGGKPAGVPASAATAETALRAALKHYADSVSIEVSFIMQSGEISAPSGGRNKIIIPLISAARPNNVTKIAGGPPNQTLCPTTIARPTTSAINPPTSNTAGL